MVSSGASWTRAAARGGLLWASLACAVPGYAPDAAAADLDRPRARGFLATCEDLARFCGASACGRDQIEAALGCRARCPSSVILRVEPDACPVVDVVLRRGG